MKRMTPYIIAITLLGLGTLTNAWADCSRDKLDDTVDKYFESLATHSTSILPLAPDAKFTENGVKKDVGEGFWKTAGKPLLKRILIDTKKCSAAVIAVIEEKFDPKTVGQGGMRGFGGGGSGGPGGGSGGPGGGMGGPGGGSGGPGGGPGGAPGSGFGGMMGQPKEMPAEGTIRPILFAARLKVEKDEVTEIETIVARENEFAFNAEGVLKTKDQDWETILPPGKRAPRKVLADAANHYFALFAEGSTVSVPFAKVCDRWENGLQTTASDHDCSPVTFRNRIGASINHGPRRVLVDFEKGISIAFMAFGGGASASEENPTGSGLVDCHMFRMRDGKVDLIQSIVGPQAQSMGWPLEPIE
ncbi:MAG: hypothetical protein JXR49_00465 [Acidobacteria bacterium]|nr:hypothetical protein [Acidobacteriota bacterium]